MRKIFVDLDGVLADFDSHYRKLFGFSPSRAPEPPDFWEQINKYPTFYRDLPVMKDAYTLWEGVVKFDPFPTILSGVPHEVPQAAQQKREWVDEHFGVHIPLITCESENKCLHAKEGDILIDDWEKYISNWNNIGGIFILHISAEDSLVNLHKVFNP